MNIKIGNKHCMIIFIEHITCIEKVHLDDLDLYVVTFAAFCNVSLTLIISIETCKEV